MRKIGVGNTETLLLFSRVLPVHYEMSHFNSFTEHLLRVYYAPALVVVVLVTKSCQTLLQHHRL